MAKPSINEAKELIEFLEDVANNTDGTTTEKIQQWWCIIELANLVHGLITFSELSECTVVFIEEVRSL